MLDLKPLQHLSLDLPHADHPLPISSSLDITGCRLTPYICLLQVGWDSKLLFGQILTFRVSYSIQLAKSVFECLPCLRPLGVRSPTSLHGNRQNVSWRCRCLVLVSSPSPRKGVWRRSSACQDQEGSSRYKWSRLKQTCSQNLMLNLIFVKHLCNLISGKVGLQTK